MLLEVSTVQGPACQGCGARGDKVRHHLRGCPLNTPGRWNYDEFWTDAWEGFTFEVRNPQLDLLVLE